MIGAESNISVIVPAYNAERYLGQALTSIQNQTLLPIEVIVVDDGSTDATAQIAETHPIQPRTIKQPNSGAAAARNLGVQEAQAEWIAFLDADDLWEPGKLESQQNALLNDKNMQMAFGHVDQFISDDVDESVKKTIACPEHSIAGYIPGTLFTRRSTFLDVGLFDTTYQLGEFIDWYARAVELGTTGVMLPEVLLHRRLHGANQTIQQRDAQSDYVRVVRAAIKRRQQSGESS